MKEEEKEEVRKNQSPNIFKRDEKGGGGGGGRREATDGTKDWDGWGWGLGLVKEGRDNLTGEDDATHGWHAVAMHKGEG
jgi:hypothetical protein